MENTTLERLAIRRIAFFGAQKMTAQGYSWTEIGEYEGAMPAADRFYRVTSPDRNEYTVMPSEANGCDCPFCWENGYCKHVEWMRWQLEEEQERQDAEDNRAYIESNAAMRMAGI